MKKNTWILGLSVLILGALVYYFQFQKDDSRSLSDGKEWQRDFAVKDTTDIETIFISKLNGLQIKLTRDGHFWKVNDKYMANPNVMKTLMSTITKLELQRTPIAKEAKNIVKSISTNGTNVKILNKDGEVIKAYFLGGSDLEGTGTEIIMEGSNQPYIVNVPYFQGVISVRFNRPEMEWRDRAVFRIDPSEIEGVSLVYPKQKSKSFKLTKEADGFYVERFYDVKEEGKRKVQSGRVDAYLSNFELKIAEAIENNHTGRDSIEQTMPFGVLDIKLSGDRTKQVNFYEIKNRYASGKVKSDEVERFLATVQPEDDFMLVQLRVFKEILRPYDYF